MIYLRFIHTFRERCPEWLMGLGTVAWGANALTDALFNTTRRLTFDGAFFAPLVTAGDAIQRAFGIDPTLASVQAMWGRYAIIVGAVRLLCLWINGRMPRGSSTARTVGAWFSFIFWIALLIGAFNLPWNASGRVTYAVFVGLDFFGLMFAASDANVAFSRARGVPKHGFA